MQQCSIYDKSLRFSRAVYGVLTLVAFSIHSHWLILAVCILLVLGTFSIKLNIFYQFHVLFLRKLSKKTHGTIQKEVAELNFVSGMTSAILFFAFLLIYFQKWIDFAWVLVLVTSLLIFLACFVGFCVASLTYALYKKILNK